MTFSVQLDSDNFFTGTGANTGKKLKFSAHTLRTNFTTYIVKGDQAISLRNSNKSGKFSDDSGVWYMMGLLRFAKIDSPSMTYLYKIGTDDGEKIGTYSDAARLELSFSESAPSSVNISRNAITRDNPIAVPGLSPDVDQTYCLKVIPYVEGAARYVEFSIPTFEVEGVTNYALEDQVTIDIYNTAGVLLGSFNSEIASDKVYVDRTVVPEGLYIFAFVKAVYAGDNSPDPGFPYTFSVGDPKYDGTVKYEEE